MNKCILVFDSGIGGLGVVMELAKSLGNDIVYIQDKKNLPYGNKGQEFVRSAVLNCLEHAKAIYNPCAIVLACNTASAVAGDDVRKKFSDTIVVAMEPAILPAIKKGYKHVIVLATGHTIQCSKISKQFCHDDRVTFIELKDFASIIERHHLETEKILDYLKNVFSTKQQLETDCVVLGCSHYRLVKAEIEACFFKNVEILSPEEAIASHTLALLKQKGL